jgi:hypothetical protein
VLNPRERVLAVLNGQKPDLVPWYGDLSYWISSLEIAGKLPAQYEGNGIYQLHRDLGVGFYLQGYFPFITKTEGVSIRHEESGGIRKTTVETPVGSIYEVWKYLPTSYTWGPQEHFVKGVEDLKVIRYWYEHSTYEPNYSLAAERYKWVGDNGLVLCYLPRSPLMQMVAELAGIEATTYALMDDEDEFGETMELLYRKADEAAQLALESPAECLMIPENLSSEVVGKNLFNSFMKPYEEKWNRKIREAGKYSFVHMDGTMKGLITETAATGFRVLEALTPSPVGDIAVGDIHRWVGEETIIWGGLPGVYFTDLVSDREFDEFTIGVLEVMKNNPRYVLGVGDQVPPGARWERIQRVSQLVEQYGRIE